MLAGGERMRCESLGGVPSESASVDTVHGQDADYRVRPIPSIRAVADMEPSHTYLENPVRRWARRTHIEAAMRTSASTPDPKLIYKMVYGTRQNGLKAERWNGAHRDLKEIGE